MLNDGNIQRCEQGMREHEEQQQWEASLSLSLKGHGVGAQGPEPDQSHSLWRGAELLLPGLDYGGLQRGRGKWVQEISQIPSLPASASQ